MARRSKSRNRFLERERIPNRGRLGGRERSVGRIGRLAPENIRSWKVFPLPVRPVRDEGGLPTGVQEIEMYIGWRSSLRIDVFLFEKHCQLKKNRAAPRSRPRKKLFTREHTWSRLAESLLVAPMQPRVLSVFLS